MTHQSPDRVYFVCGTCAAIFLAAGAVRAPSVTEISLGQACETHGKEPVPGATSAFEGTPEAVDRMLAKARGKERDAAIDAQLAGQAAGASAAALEDAGRRMAASLGALAHGEGDGSGGADDDLAVSVHDRETSRGFEVSAEEGVAPVAAQASKLYFPEEKLPETSGPLTMIAASLLGSWSANDPTRCDTLHVDHAVSVARMLLLQTKGA